MRESIVAVYFRYLATTMLTMTAFVTVCILVPMGGGFRKMLLSGNGPFHHTLNPIISSVYITRAGSRLLSGQLFCLGQYLHLR